MDKNKIDEEAMREANALRKQGYGKRDKRINLRDDYNTSRFDRLFIKTTR